MTPSGTPPGDEAGLEQEEIWEDAQGADAPPALMLAGTSRRTSAAASRGLTRNITSTARTPGPAGLYYADVPNRIMALVIDIIVLSVIGFVLAWLFGGLVSEPGALDSAGGELDIVAFLVVLLLQLAISFGYFGALWSHVRAGRWACACWGCASATSLMAEPSSWRQAAIRWLFLGIPSLLASLAVYVPNTIGLILAALGVAWMLLLLYTIAQSPTKQGLHDRYAHTIVVRADAGRAGLSASSSTARPQRARDRGHRSGDRPRSRGQVALTCAAATSA